MEKFMTTRSKILSRTLVWLEAGKWSRLVQAKNKLALCYQKQKFLINKKETVNQDWAHFASVYCVLEAFFEGTSLNNFKKHISSSFNNIERVGTFVTRFVRVTTFIPGQYFSQSVFMFIYLCM